MPFVQVSVRQTEYTSKNENEATLSYNNRISIFPVPSDATKSVIVCVCVCLCVPVSCRVRGIVCSTPWCVCVCDELMNE